MSQTVLKFMGCPFGSGSRGTVRRLRRRRRRICRAGRRSARPRCAGRTRAGRPRAGRGRAGRQAGGRGDGLGAAAGTTAAASGGRSRAPPVRGLVDHRLVRLGVGHVGSFLVHAGSVGCQVPGRCQMTPPCGLSAATRPASRGSRQASPRRCLVHAESELNVSWQPAQWQRPAPPHRAPQECVLSISGPSMTRPAPRGSRNGP